MKKVLVAGSSTVDLIFQSDALETRQRGSRWSLAHGGKYIVDSFDLCMGGGGGNAAVSLSKQGISVYLYTRIGKGYFGNKSMALMKKFKINTSLVKKMSDYNPISAVLIDRTGDKTIFNYRSKADQLKITRTVLSTLSKVNWVALYSLAKWPKKEKLSFFKAAKARDVHIFLSLHGSEYKKGLKYLKNYFRYASIIHLNAYELADIYGKKAENINFYKENLAKKLGIPIVLLSYDVKGSFAYTDRQIYYQSAVKTDKVLDATGAGDAFSSGFLGTYLKTADIKKSLHFGAKNACSVIKKYGAQNGLLAT